MLLYHRRDEVCRRDHRWYCCLRISKLPGPLAEPHRPACLTVRRRGRGQAERHPPWRGAMVCSQQQRSPHVPKPTGGRAATPTPAVRPKTGIGKSQRQGRDPDGKLTRGGLRFLAPPPPGSAAGKLPTMATPTLLRLKPTKAWIVTIPTSSWWTTAPPTTAPGAERSAVPRTTLCGIRNTAVPYKPQPWSSFTATFFPPLFAFRLCRSPPAQLW
jgi:hypothetical protein